MRLFFIIAIAVFLTKTTAAQVSAKATVDSTHMLIGDHMRLHVEVSQQNGIVVQPIKPSVKEGSPLEFLSESKWDTLKGGSSLLLRKELVFTAWDSGYQRVPPISVVFKNGKKLDSVRTNDIPVYVEMPVADTTLADIKPIIAEPSTWKDYLPHIGTVVALLILAVLYFATRKKQEEEPPPPPPVLIPVHEIALQKLKLLESKKLWQKGELKAYHSELTHIAREYLEMRYGIKALEHTTEEILFQLKETGFDTDLSGKLTQLLQTADLVKFAKAKPAAYYHEKAMTFAEEFIQETKSEEIKITPSQIPLNQGYNYSIEVSLPANISLPSNINISNYELAGFWQRFFARLIDFNLLPMVILATAFGLGMALGLNNPPEYVTWILVLFFICLIWAYYAFMDHWKGGTLGKLMLGIEVVDLEGERLTLRKTTVRFFGKILSEALFGLGNLLYFTDKKRRQTLHDRIAGTIVIKKRKSKFSEKSPQPLDSFD